MLAIQYIHPIAVHFPIVLILLLAGFDLIVGYNVTKFDYRVLAGYSDLANYLDAQTFDLLLEVIRQSMSPPA